MSVKYYVWIGFVVPTLPVGNQTVRFLGVWLIKIHIEIKLFARKSKRNQLNFKTTIATSLNWAITQKFTHLQYGTEQFWKSFRTSSLLWDCWKDGPYIMITKNSFNRDKWNKRKTANCSSGGGESNAVCCCRNKCVTVAGATLFFTAHFLRCTWWDYNRKYHFHHHHNNNNNNNTLQLQLRLKC